MRKKNESLLPIVLTILVMIVSFISTWDASAASEEVLIRKPVADVIIGPYSIKWHPKTAYKHLLLIVSRPDGSVFNKTFEAGTVPHLEISSSFGKNAPEGTYTYELRIVPAAVSQKALVQAGYFVISGKKIVTTNDNVEKKDKLPGEDPNSSHDWRIVIDEKARNSNGDFSVKNVNEGTTPFTIESGAPSNSLYIDKNGRVGIGTTTASAHLNLVATGEHAVVEAQRTDGATAIFSARSRHASLGTKSVHKMNFVINNQPRVTIDTNGNLGIGLTSPSYPLHMAGGAHSDGTSWINGSSIEFKENIKNLNAGEAMNAFNALVPVKFNYKSNKKEECVGFIAENVPDLVATGDRKGMNPMDVVAVLTKVVQEQQKTLSELKKKIAEIEKN